MLCMVQSNCIFSLMSIKLHAFICCCFVVVVIVAIGGGVAVVVVVIVVSTNRRTTNLVAIVPYVHPSLRDPLSY